MRLLFLGDIVGRTGRDAVIERLPRLREQLGVDFTVINAENAAHGFGLTAKICEELFDAGADCLTTGNHVWDQREMIGHIEGEPRLVRPANYPDGTPGRGATMLTGPKGHQVLVCNVMCRLFMDPLDDPFACIDRVLGDSAMPRDADFILVDVHGEATSEKTAMGHYLDGRASLVVGTHTHVPTADHRILDAGTAYQTDAGMCGDYDSVIGMKKQPAIDRFVSKMPGERLSPAEGVASVCGVLVETDPATGLARRIEPVRAGGRLAPLLPALEVG